jgi:DNA polymerase-2
VLRPLLTRRLQLKARLTQLDPRDCRYAPLKAQVAALKWLLVVSYGYLGYPHARFGAQAAHEAVTAWGREHMLRAKEAAEDAGWRVLHMYVDGLWGQKEGVTAAEITALQAEVNRRTQLTLALEGVYRWLAFLPSRTDARIAVPNRYFGVFQDGRVKVRGLALRRRDTCNWVRTGQQGLLQRLAEAPDYPSAATLQTALAYLHAHAERLRTGQVPMAALVCAQTLSRPPEAYRVASSAAEVARQRRASGLDAFPGQTMRYVHTLGIPSITAWREQTALCPDQEMYLKRLARAAAEVLEPFGVSAAAILTSLTGVPSQKFLLNLQTQSDVLHKTNHRPL